MQCNIFIGSLMQCSVFIGGLLQGNIFIGGLMQCCMSTCSLKIFLDSYIIELMFQQFQLTHFVIYIYRVVTVHQVSVNHYLEVTQLTLLLPMLTVNCFMFFLHKSFQNPHCETASCASLANLGNVLLYAIMSVCSCYVQSCYRYVLIRLFFILA